MDGVVLGEMLRELLEIAAFKGEIQLAQERAVELPEGQAILATAMVAAKLFVSVQANHQQTGNFVGFKSLTAFELAIDPNTGPA
jgi:hypothetical protein